MKIFFCSPSRVPVKQSNMFWAKPHRQSLYGVNRPLYLSDLCLRPPLDNFFFHFPPFLLLALFYNQAALKYLPPQAAGAGGWCVISFFFPPFPLAFFVHLALHPFLKTGFVFATVPYLIDFLEPRICRYFRGGTTLPASLPLSSFLRRRHPSTPYLDRSFLPKTGTSSVMDTVLGSSRSIVFSFISLRSPRRLSVPLHF